MAITGRTSSDLKQHPRNHYRDQDAVTWLPTDLDLVSLTRTCTSSLDFSSNGILLVSKSWTRCRKSRLEFLPSVTLQSRRGTIGVLRFMRSGDDRREETCWLSGNAILLRPTPWSTPFKCSANIPLRTYRLRRYISSGPQTRHPERFQVDYVLLHGPGVLLYSPATGMQIALFASTKSCEFATAPLISYKNPNFFSATLAILTMLISASFRKHIRVSR